MDTLPPPIIRTKSGLQTVLARWRSTEQRIALVPTMGALHDGHISLGKVARTQADRVVFSIFVNPAQFAPQEDFSRYPRTEAKDVASLAEHKVADVVFAPFVEEIYPTGFSTSVSVGGPAHGLESDTRPHFFAGVATVVTKLLTLIGPDIAIFGEKDYQQLKVIEQLSRDLDINVQIMGCPTLREDDGLAKSSRNAYLSIDQRKVAGALNRIMREAVASVAGGDDPRQCAARSHVALLNAGFDTVEYFEFRHAMTLSAEIPAGSPLRLLAAARLGSTRLIDNMAV